MDDWTYPYPDVDPQDTQPALVDRDWRVIEARRVRVERAEAACIAPLERTEARDGVGDLHTYTEIALAFAAPSGAALTL